MLFDYVYDQGKDVTLNFRCDAEELHSPLVPCDRPPEGFENGTNRLLFMENNCRSIFQLNQNNSYNAEFTFGNIKDLSILHIPYHGYWCLGGAWITRLDISSHGIDLVILEQLGKINLSHIYNPAAFFSEVCKNNYLIRNYLLPVLSIIYLRLWMYSIVGKPDQTSCAQRIAYSISNLLS